MISLAGLWISGWKVEKRNNHLLFRNRCRSGRVQKFVGNVSEVVKALVGYKYPRYPGNVREAVWIF